MRPLRCQSNIGVVLCKAGALPGVRNLWALAPGREQKSFAKAQRGKGRERSGPRLLLSAICTGLLVCSSCSRFSTTTNQRPPASPGAPKVRSSADVVKVTPGSMSVSAGASADGALIISISPGYHVNANPATFPYLIPTELTPQKIEGVTTGKPRYPPSEKKKFQFAEAPLAVYEGDAQIKLPIRAASAAVKGMRPLPITLRVQACDHEKCYPPANLNSYISVEVK